MAQNVGRASASPARLAPDHPSLAHIRIGPSPATPVPRSESGSSRVSALTIRASAVVSTSGPTMILSPPTSKISIRPVEPEAGGDRSRRRLYDSHRHDVHWFAAAGRPPLSPAPGEQHVGVQPITARHLSDGCTRLEALCDDPLLLISCSHRKASRWPIRFERSALLR